MAYIDLADVPLDKWYECRFEGANCNVKAKLIRLSTGVCKWQTASGEILGTGTLQAIAETK